MKEVKCQIDATKFRRHKKIFVHTNKVLTIKEDSHYRNHSFASVGDFHRRFKRLCLVVTLFVIIKIWTNFDMECLNKPIKNIFQIN